MQQKDYFCHPDEVFDESNNNFNNDNLFVQSYKVLHRARDDWKIIMNIG